MIPGPDDWQISEVKDRGSMIAGLAFRNSRPASTIRRGALPRDRRGARLARSVLWLRTDVGRATTTTNGYLRPSAGYHPPENDGGSVDSARYDSTTANGRLAIADELAGAVGMSATPKSTFLTSPDAVAPRQNPQACCGTARTCRCRDCDSQRRPPSKRPPRPAVDPAPAIVATDQRGGVIASHTRTAEASAQALGVAGPATIRDQGKAAAAALRQWGVNATSRAGRRPRSRRII